MVKNYNFDEIVKNFNFKGEFIEAKSHICGHINDTFILKFKNENNSEQKYVLQRINTAIFKDPDKLMENIKNVTAHIAKKVKEVNGDPLRETLNIIPTKEGKTYYVTEQGDYLRAFVFIDGARTYQIVEKPEHLYTSGKALGKFQKQLADFPVEILHETIPYFHHTEKRYEAFLEAIKKDEKGRVIFIKDDIDFVIKRAEDTKVLVSMIEKGILPLRVTHNDTKFNNVMIDDETGEGIAVIDLDTVMPGLSLYDFGDSIRSGATTALEDEMDLSKVNFDINLYEQYSKGFLEEVKESLTKEEIEYLPFGAKLMTFECGMRFLMDYINGDVYFKIHREKHNLERARNQFKLVLDMEKQMEEMQNIIKKYC
ncbi:phosphotransferase enzyme family protein [Clostridium tarantellae]|uniref:Phosphotransferase n=1 Tax=Clostridium tarantellae TaxID=39493 RepID=A0A6I1ML65_9CLOT|nr:aminoglycoside phosphotransferase family protein [Clostridium tarantellae]MPQ44145.1 phosphotransferase [Clostridium tarantellae]